MNLSLESMSCGYHGTPVLSHVSFTVEEGEVLCILGPNGVGKTTLFKSMLGLLKPLSGRVLIDGDDISSWSPRRRARYIGYIPQSHTPPFPYSVLQVVVMGRISRLGRFSSPGPEEYDRGRDALASLDIEHLAERIYTEISGGERQMVLIARALAQDPRILLMDEPTANLDYGNQARVLWQINRLARQGMVVVMTTHAPDHAFLCPSRVVLIERESGITFGTADEIVTRENLERTYGIGVRILSGIENDAVIKSCVPLVDTVDQRIRRRQAENDRRMKGERA